MKPLVISMGDAAGIGPEIILKGLGSAPAEATGCVVLGDIKALHRAKALPGVADLPLALAELDTLEQAAQLPPRCLGVLQSCDLPEPPAWGRISAAAGHAAGQCISAGARAVLTGRACALVTAPHPQRSHGRSRAALVGLSRSYGVVAA
jgi:4-hydroxythreonine-4-phosphate dehydrogenase